MASLNLSELIQILLKFVVYGAIDKSALVQIKAWFWRSNKTMMTHFTNITRAPFQYPIRRLIVRPHEALKLQNLYLELPNRSKIWLAHRQHCCRCAWEHANENIKVWNFYSTECWGKGWGFRGVTCPPYTGVVNSDLLSYWTGEKYFYLSLQWYF